MAKFLLGISLFAVCGLFTALAGCAPQQPQTPTLNEAPPPLTPAEHVDVPPDPLATLPGPVQQAYESGNRRPVKDGFALFYPFKTDDMPTVQASPEHATEIVFGQGERVASITLGDPMRWDVKVAGNRVLIKPCPQGCSNTGNTGAAAGMPVPEAPKVFSTNLIVDTSARSYHVWLHCGGRPMESFNFWFPDDIAAAQQARSEALRKSGEQTAASPAQLNRNYAISGPAVPWRPDAAFDDGSREWLHFPDKAALESDMPTLYALQGKTETLVNWTPAAGNYYVVDRLYQAAVLTVGSGKDRPEIRITARAN